MRSDTFMNAEDVARYLHLGKNTVYQLAKTGKLASYHVGRKLKFTLEDVEAYVASTHHAPTAAPVGSYDSSPAAKAPVHHVSAQGSAHSLSDAATFGSFDSRPFVIAGGDPSADMLAGALNSAGIHASRLVCASYTALVKLYAKDADAAIVGLYDRACDSYNVSYVRNLVPGTPVVVFRLYGCNVGFIVQKGNPKGLDDWSALLREDVCLSNREKGSDARVLLDEMLCAFGARRELIEGYDTHYAVGSMAAKRVASGVADVAIGNEMDMRGVGGVEFVPLQQGFIDLAVRKVAESRSMIARLEDVLSGERLRLDMATLAPCDLGPLGTRIYEQ